MLPEEFTELFPKIAVERDDRPLYVLWVFDPSDGTVHVDHNEDRHPAEHVTHTDMAERVKHPARIHGYAYKIKGGWRITTSQHRPVEDPYVIREVRLALRGETKKVSSEPSQIGLRAVS